MKWVNQFVLMALLKLLNTVTWRCSVKKMFLKISQNSLKNTCARVSLLIKLQASACIFFLKKSDSGTGVFLWILQNFQDYLFYRTTVIAASGQCLLFDLWSIPHVWLTETTSCSLLSYRAYPLIEHTLSKTEKKWKKITCSIN